MSDNLYRCSPNQIEEYVTDCLYAGLVPYIQGSPGMGKSSIVHGVGKKLNLKVIDHRLSTSAPEDLSGLPRFTEKGTAEFVPFTDIFPIEGMSIPDGYDGWLLFLDELNQAKKDVQAAAYKLILDRMTGQYKLHPRVVIIAAGNLDTDRAIVTQMGTAMQSRLVHLEMELSHDEWMKNVAIPQKYDSRVLAFLMQYPSKLNDFDPGHKNKTFTCPRTWEFVNRFMKGKEFKMIPNPNPDFTNQVYQLEQKTPLIAGMITATMAVDFIQFTKIFQNIPEISEIEKNPDGIAVPTDNSLKWATICSMMEHLTEKNFEKLAIYANKFDLTFKILFYRAIQANNPKLVDHPQYRKSALELYKYLNGN